MRKSSLYFLVSVVLLAAAVPGLAQRRAMSFVDVMKFRAISDPVISADGSWIAYQARPDRGDGVVELVEVDTGRSLKIEKGSKPQVTTNGRWAAVQLNPPFSTTLEKKKDGPKAGLVIVRLADGTQETLERVGGFTFSRDGQWFAYQHLPPDQKKAGDDSETEEEKDKRKPSGQTLVLRHLESSREHRVENTGSFVFSRGAEFLAYSVQQPSEDRNGLFVRDLSTDRARELSVHRGSDTRYDQLTWTRQTKKLAFVSAAEDAKGKMGDAVVHLYDAPSTQLRPLATSDQAPSGLGVPFKNQLAWSRDGQRLFFGFKAESDEGSTAGANTENSEGDSEKGAMLFDIEAILKGREVDVWHWNDPLINSQQKIMWPRTKDQTLRAVHHLDSGKTVALASKAIPQVALSDNPRSVLGTSDVPYSKEKTWEGDFQDVHLFDLQTGGHQRVAERLAGRASLSPDGRWVVFYQNKHWHLFDAANGSTRNLTESLDVPFANEDHDYPSQVPGYGVGGWMADSGSVLINDKFDIWEFSTGGARPRPLTEGTGRAQQVTFRVVRVDADQPHLGPGQAILLSAYWDRTKEFGFFQAANGSLKSLVHGPKRFRFVAKAAEADRLIYTREAYDEFPDLWVTDSGYEGPRRLTDVNPQMSDFAWGSTELVEWMSLDGTPMQGALIKPGNYDPNKRYPVLIYYYRFFSQRLNEFNQPVVNHRPCFPLYASNGYAVFLPDIRFEVGHPGPASVKSLVPGVQKLIDMGIADPKGLGLHGHSWSGYQTAYIITQTNIFAAAIAGAPVSNMTSAYGGIRWGSGRSRQFQYEMTQSRIGGSLWEYPERYIENSPLFFADRIETPLLIQFGDEDGAVPWYQGIELYMAMRRLGKDSVFLQYRGEPHHLQKYPNKLDYAIKMKEYLDHYLKGTPVPKWIAEGVAYQGK